jgi:hypothetical protein
VLIQDTRTSVISRPFELASMEKVVLDAINKVREQANMYFILTKNKSQP